ncbi:MAG: response regulator [Bacteroidetes bacterium]|nr:response regulator [Bacteroidota bacterium]
MADLTPRDDNKKLVSEILKRVDQLIKSKTLDRKNIYISAYEERLNALMEETKKQRIVDEQKKKELEDAQKRLDDQRAKTKAEEELRKKEQFERQAAEEKRRTLEEDTRRREEEQLRKSQERLKQEDEARHEEKKKSKLDEKIERKIEERVLARLREELGRPKIVIIDDDQKLLTLFKEAIEEGGYTVEAFSTSDEAYKHLGEHIPDLIICDINLETSTMGGFTFFEKIREINELAEVPFIFLTGLTDEVLVRTGKELGVDDYLTKPISEKALLSTIKGKIKRFQELKKHK